MDAMSDAIDQAAVVLYGVSLAYKGACPLPAGVSHRRRLLQACVVTESANCRLEANYVSGTRG